jgi:hypothetical protein
MCELSPDFETILTNLLQEHRSMLIFECKGFHTVDRLVVEVVGEACVPEIVLLDPEADETGFISLKFFPTLIGNCATHDVAFKNVGVIPCKVIVEVCFDDLNQFSLMPKEDTLPLLNLWEATG